MVAGIDPPRFRGRLGGVRSGAPHVWFRLAGVLTEIGYAIAEIDSVPGGIGLVDWLKATYAELGCEVIGGVDGMLRGFTGVFPGADIVASEEAATYRPEMEWLAGRLNAGFPDGEPWRVTDAEPRSDSAERLTGFSNSSTWRMCRRRARFWTACASGRSRSRRLSSPRWRRSCGSRCFG